MSDDAGITAPTAIEIEDRFRHPAVVVTRPIIRGGIRTLRMVRRFGWESVGAEKLRTLEAPLIFAANHLSHADTPAILDTLPRALRHKTTVAAALDVFGSAARDNRHRWRKECLQLFVAAGFHAFAFDRHGPPLRSVRTSVELIRNGWSLLLYPEGTRSRSGAMGPFKAGVGVLSRVTGRPVIPVHVDGGRAILPHDALIPGAGRITVRYGEPMMPEAGERPAAFAERLRVEVRRLGGLHADTVRDPAKTRRREGAVYDAVRS